VPVNGIVCGEFGALSVNTRFADLAPTLVGVNVTVTVQFAPTFRVAPQVVVLANCEVSGPVNVIEVIDRVVEPSLVRVTTRPVDVEFTTWVEKSTESGLGVAAGLEELSNWKTRWSNLRTTPPKAGSSGRLFHAI